MSLHNAAKHLAAHGRGPDTTLVHMTPREVGGLQAIAKAHGGSLTINPHTGLAEAGFLSRILPTLAGAGLMMIPGMQPLGAAALVGGGTMLANGGDLRSGLMAGLGAYGGAGLAEGAFGAAEAATPPVEAVQAPVTAPPAPTAASTGFTATPADPTLSKLTPDMYANQAKTIEAGFGTTPFEPRPDVMAGNYAQQGFGMNNASSLSNPTTGTGTGFERVQSNFMAKPTYGLAALAPNINTDRAPIPGQEEYNGPLSRYRMSDNYQPFTQQQPNPYYTPTRYNYAGGGPVEQMSNENMVGANTGYPQADINKPAYATPYQTPVSENVVQGTTDTGVNRMTGEMNFAGGGHLGGYSDGGRMLKGPGDGMSDSIPATIGAKQPARLANEEFVVPADVVSHLGNGSSEAGAKQLYKMMDRIRQQRTGKKRQAPQVNPNKVMPA